MEPIEINAGSYYLRAMYPGPGAIDDRQPVLDAFTDAELRRYAPEYAIDSLDAAAEYIGKRIEQWHTGTRCSWAAAEPASGQLLAEIGIKRLDFVAETGEIGCWTHPARRGQGVLAAVLPAVLRFGHAALGLHHIGYRHAAGNTASERLAAKAGFTLDGRLRQAVRVDGHAEDLLLWSRLATDPE